MNATIEFSKKAPEELWPKTCEAIRAILCRIAFEIGAVRILCLENKHCVFKIDHYDAWKKVHLLTQKYSYVLVDCTDGDDVTFDLKIQCPSKALSVEIA